MGEGKVGGEKEEEGTVGEFMVQKYKKIKKIKNG